MGILDFLKKKATVTKQQSPPQKAATNSLGERLDRLTHDGELPWGWHTYTKEFTSKINGEYSYFLHLWIDSKNGSPKERYQALKSFVLYLEDAEKLCKSKGECFEFWYYNIVASKDYIAKRKSELEELIANFDKLQADFEKRAVHLSDLDGRIIKMLNDNPGVLQSEFVKMFDQIVQNDVREKLYFMEKAGELERTKSGRSYILNYKRKG